MDIKDLKVGDVVYIREDLEHGAWYGGYMYINAMNSGVKQIQYIYGDEGFSVVCGKGARYTSEMVDWEETKRLQNNNCCDFEKITQFVENGKEKTVALTNNGEKIAVTNNDKENDIEKAVMMLMLKSFGVTYRDVKKEVEKVKVKWKPIAGEEFYYIATTPALEVKAVTYFTDGALKSVADVGNCFRTIEDAEEKLKKIKEVLKGE